MLFFGQTIRFPFFIMVLLSAYPHYANSLKTLPGVGIDLTDPLNKLNAGELLLNDIDNILTSLSTSLENNEGFSSNKILYSVESQAKEDCQKETEMLSSFVLHRLSRNVSTELIILVPFTQQGNRKCVDTLTNKLANLQRRIENGKSLPHLKNSFGIAFSLKDTDDCNQEHFSAISSQLSSRKQITNSPQATVNTPTFIWGISINEKLKNCSHLSSVMDLADFVIIKINLGAFVESYGLFERKLEQSHKKIVNILPKNSRNNSQIAYYLSIGSLPEYTNHITTNKKLAQFAITWVSKYPSIGLIVPVIKLNAKNSSLSSNSDEYLNIPYILETGTNGDINGREDMKWYSKSALKALTEKFNSVVLTHSQWYALTSERSVDRRNFPDIFIDYSYPPPPIDFDWEDAGNELISKNAGANNVKLLAVPVAVNTTGLQQISQEVQDFLVKMNATGFFQLGCSLTLPPNMTLNDEEGKTVAKVCQKIGGNFFFLAFQLNLEEARENEFSYSYYVSTIQEYLNQLQQARQIIQGQISTSTKIYIRLITQPSSQLDENYPVTIFCNEDALNVNQYYEAIQNWAKANKFPIILKSAFDSVAKPHVSSWMSVLRPTQSVSHLSNSRPQIATTNPTFVMRNYPKLINGWKTDLCIPWSVGNDTPFLAPDYFKNSQTGAVLTLPMLEDGSVGKEEIQTMLQFILHKFSFLEVFVQKPSHLTTFTDANSPTFLSKVARNNLTTSAKLFIHFEVNMNEVKSLGNLTVIHQKLREFQGNTIVSAEGVHIQYPEVVSKYGARNLVPSIAHQIRTLGAIKAGHVIPNNCMDLLQQISTSSEHNKDLTSVDYIVCKEWLDVGRRNEDDLKSLGTRFDTHLYIKRTLAQSFPKLGLYFKLEVSIDLQGSLKENMERYLKLLYHIQQFGAAYQLQYFVIETFEKENNFGKRKNGWWNIKNYTDLTNVDVYVEKVAEYQNNPTWKPEERIYRRPNKENDGKGTVWTTVLSVGAVIFVMFLGVGLFLVFWYRKQEMFMTSKEIQEFRNEGIELGENPTGTCKFSSDYELTLADINIDFGKILGSGQFGVVYRGFVKGEQAAIKSPKTDCSKTSFKNELGEVKVLCHLGSHPHIVTFLGAYIQEIQKGKLFIATELCENGSLETYLRSKKSSISHLPDGSYVNLTGIDELGPDLLQEICQFSIEVARGMEYIASKNVVHGDLAARNVLLDFNLSCKISDFGLSRKVYEYQKYVKTSQEPLPWKWMAYESLAQMEFTSMSDMWSYGVTVWEIYSLGNTPFGGLNYNVGYVNDVRNGLRLPAPQFACQEIYGKLQECWKFNPQERPSFTEMVDFFTGLRTKEYTELVPLN